MGARPEDDITAGEIDEFRHPQTRLYGNEERNYSPKLSTARPASAI